MASSQFCTEHYAMVYDRGGTRRVGQFTDLSRVQWNRDRDSTSDAQVVIEGSSCEKQRGLLQRISTKRHELVIFRGEDRVWEGPIYRIGDEGNRIVIAAKDVTAYLFGTALSKEWDNTYGSALGPMTVTERLQLIIEYELATSRTGRISGGTMVPIPGWETLDPPVNLLPYLNVHHFPNEARTAARTQAFEMTVGEHMASLARTSGVDFTAIGRSIHLWDTSRNIGQTRTLTENDFYGNIIVTEYGADHTQGAYVLGQEGLYGETINPDGLDFYGPWMTIYNAYNEEATTAPTQSELNSQSARNLSGRSPAPVEVRVPDNSTIRLSDTLRIGDLVPGARIPLLATLNARSRNQDQKLDHLRVQEDGGSGENISVTLTPATKRDSDEEEEGA